MVDCLTFIFQEPSENILVTHNNYDSIFRLSCGVINTVNVHDLKLTNKYLCTDNTLIGFNYSSGINSLMGCSESGELYLWDLRINLQHPSSESKTRCSDALFTCSSISNDGSLICCGTELVKNGKGSKSKRSSDDKDYAYLVYWDTRFLSNPLGVHKKLHSDDITDVKFDPSSLPGYLRLIHSADDGVVCFIDLSASNEEDSVLEMFNSESTVSSCDWLHSSVCDNDIVGIYCTTSMRTNMITWNISPHFYRSNNSPTNNNNYYYQYQLSDENANKLVQQNQEWQNNLKSLCNGRRYFRLKIEYSNQFLLLGELDDEIGSPSLFYLKNQNSIWSINKNNLQLCNNNKYEFGLICADFFGSPNQNLCFFINSSSILFCSYKNIIDI